MPPRGELISFADATPAASTKWAGIAERFDPYFSPVWQDSSGGAAMSWLSNEALARLGTEGLVKQRARGKHHYQSAEEALSALPFRPKWQKALGAINLFQTLTTQQLAAITDDPDVMYERSVTLDALFIAGLIQRGGFSLWQNRLRTDKTPELLRIHPRAHKVDLSHLLYQDWLGVSSGAFKTRGHNWDRHNLLTTELCLRVAELCPTIPLVLGEALADLTRYADPKHPLSGERMADGVLLREDGLRILIETTLGGSSSVLAAKCNEYALMLANDRSDSVSVLFVAARGDDWYTGANRRQTLRRIIGTVIAGLHGRIRGKVARHIAVADWRDWFPEPGCLHRSFRSLTATVPTGPTSDRWQPVALADPMSTPMQPSDQSLVIDMETTLANAANLYGVPHWLRGTVDPDPLIRHLLAQAGLPEALLFDPVTGDLTERPPPVPGRPQRKTWAKIKKTVGPSPRVLSERWAAAYRASNHASDTGRR
jgi:hypothetical protein